MCKGCTLTEEEALTITELNCYGCASLESIGDLPLCTVLWCYRCTSLESIGALPSCTKLDCDDCTSLVAIGDLPSCTKLDCNECPNLTHLYVSDRCIVLCNNSPISKWNQAAYLQYINARLPIVSENMLHCLSYEPRIANIIMMYI